jgi:hypothetical protein
MLSEFYACGHIRTERYKHVCPMCKAKKKPTVKKERMAFEKRKELALARIVRTLASTSGLGFADTADKLGISKQRCLQLVEWLEAWLEDHPAKEEK